MHITPLRSTRVGVNKIRATDNILVPQPYRRIIPTQIDSVKKRIDKWEIAGIIMSCKNGFSSPLLIVNKVM